jgi:hypothetical protein
MAIEELKEFWNDLRSGSEYQTEGLNDDPNAPRTDHWFKDYALPVGLNALMSPFQGIKDMYVDTPVDVLKGHPLEAMEEFWYPMMGALEGYEDQYHFPFNPELDPEFDVSAFRPPLTPSIDDLSIRMINSQKPVISDIGKWMLKQGAGTTNLSDYTNIPGNWLAQYIGARGLGSLAGLTGTTWAASKAFPWSMQVANKAKKSLSKAIEPWGAAPTGKWQKIKNLWKSANMPSKETSKQWAINAGLPLIAHQMFGNQGSTGIDVMASEIPDSWDRDPVTFDPYIQERMNRMEAPQDERRGPGPWNEFKG